MTTKTDEQLLIEIEQFSEEIKQLCAGQFALDIPGDTPRGKRLSALQAALNEARRCVCQDKLAKWEARRNG